MPLAIKDAVEPKPLSLSHSMRGPPCKIRQNTWTVQAFPGNIALGKQRIAKIRSRHRRLPMWALPYSLATFSSNRLPISDILTNFVYIPPAVVMLIKNTCQ